RRPQPEPRRAQLRSRRLPAGPPALQPGRLQRHDERLHRPVRDRLRTTDGRPAVTAGCVCLPPLPAREPPPTPPPPSPSPPAAPAATPAPPPSPSTAPEYRVGPGDVLEVNVLDNAEVSRTPTVQTSGMIVLPLLGEVEVAGLTVPEIQRKLTTLLARDYLVN